MDLRPYSLSPSRVEEAIGFIRQTLLSYQPYIITDTLEVGQGQIFHDGHNPSAIFDTTVYCDRDLGLPMPQAKDLEHFRRCNADYRRIYTAFADQIATHFSRRMPELTFSEIGCNSGLNLFNLARRGAGRCMGFDWNDMTRLFAWLNGILGTQVEFRQAVWNRLYHYLEGIDHPEVDVMISTVVLNHQVDFLAHLAFLCDHAKEAVFLWVLTEETDAKDAADAAWAYAPSREYAISYTEPNALRPLQSGNDWQGPPFPLCLDQGICITDPLLRRCLGILGFKEIVTLRYPPVAPAWEQFCRAFKPYLAIRTAATKSAYWGQKPPISAR